jgi:hypothetical protein
MWMWIVDVDVYVWMCGCVGICEYVHVQRSVAVLVVLVVPPFEAAETRRASVPDPDRILI